MLCYEVQFVQKLMSPEMPWFQFRWQLVVFSIPVGSTCWRHIPAHRFFSRRHGVVGTGVAGRLGRLGGHRNFRGRFRQQGMEVIHRLHLGRTLSAGKSLREDTWNWVSYQISSVVGNHRLLLHPGNCFSQLLMPPVTQAVGSQHFHGHKFWHLVVVNPHGSHEWFHIWACLEIDPSRLLSKNWPSCFPICPW